MSLVSRRCLHPRLTIRRAALWLFIVGGLFLLYSRQSIRQSVASPFFHRGFRQEEQLSGGRPQRVSCHGPRGTLLSHSPDDELRYGHPSEISYPTPFIGSHRALGAEQTWMTADGRYGPYGFGEDTDKNNRSRVNWDQVSWGQLQNGCFERNRHRFLPATSISSGNLTAEPRLTWKNETKIGATTTPPLDPNSGNATRRTVLLLRAWSTFEYKPQNLWNIRSLIAETALRTGGEYSVVLFVHVQDRSMNIFQSRENYDAAFRAANIPPELRSIAVLWDDHLLESWYDKIQEHATVFQVNQPVQLFALHYPEFDHYWQIEMDQWFLGDAGKYLDAVSAFARDEPRKQALERATYAFNDDMYGTYHDFIGKVDLANNGKSRAWGPIEIPDIKPIGEMPPMANPADDSSFTWGVGEEADVVVPSFCADALQTKWWVFYWRIKGFTKGLDTPRWFCPPAMMRASRRLLLAVHQAQHDQGLMLTSEDTLPSWALWHGLKLSYPPQPVYMQPREPQWDWKDDWTRDSTQWLNTTITPWFGNSTDQSRDGLAHGDPQSRANDALTFWWTSRYPRKIFDAWLAGDVEDKSMPGILVVHEGKIYAPNMAMHPVKSY